MPQPQGIPSLINPYPTPIMAPKFLRELIPRREKRAASGSVVVAFKTLSWVQWVQFWSGSVPSLVSCHHHLNACFTSWLAWTCDAIDFFAVSLTVNLLAKQFNQSTTSIVRFFGPSFAACALMYIAVTDDRYNVDPFIPTCRCCEHHSRCLSVTKLNLSFPRLFSVSYLIDLVASGH